MTDTLLILPTIGANVEKACATIAALRANTYGPFGLCIILDAPDEQSAARLSEAADGLAVQVHMEGARRGLVGAYRAGFAFYAATDFEKMALLEDNVLVTEGWDRVLRRTLDAHPEFGWVACGQLENPAAPFTSLCSMMTREAALATDGGPDLAFAPCQFDDGDMFMRLVAKGFRPHAIPHLVSHPEARTSREGTIEDDWRLIEAHRAIFQARWGVSEFHWNLVPVHAPCARCGGRD